jgi:hypothetical protein
VLVTRIFSFLAHFFRLASTKSLTTLVQRLEAAVGMQKPALLIPTAFPHPIKQEELTIPRSLFYLSTSSILVTFILLIVSLLDLGYCSLWLTPPVCILTLIYFAGVLYVSRMERTVEDPTYFSTVVVVGYVMTSIWLIAFILTIVVFAVYPHMVEALEQRGLHSVSVGLQRFQCILCVANLGLVGGFAVRSHIIAMVEGDPENWRVLVEKNADLATNRQIWNHGPGPDDLNDPSMIQAPRAAPAIPVPPDWVTAIVLEENEREFSAALTDEESYVSDYYEESEHPPQEGATYMEKEQKGYSDGDSLYSESMYVEPETPDSPDKWSDAEEVEEEYHAKAPK